MKHLIFILSFLLMNESHAQELVVFDTIVQMPGYTGQDIFTKTISWIGENYRNAESVITLQNREDLTLAGRVAYKHKLVMGSPMLFTYLFNIAIKDGKAKLHFGNITNTYGYSAEYYVFNKKGYRRPAYNKMYTDMINNCRIFAVSLQKYILEKKNDDW